MLDLLYRKSVDSGDLALEIDRVRRDESNFMENAIKFTSFECKLNNGII